MQVTVIGANGRVGRLVVSEALQRGYKVVAFCHSVPRFEEQPGLRIVRGDIHDAAAVAQALHGSHYIISALGSWHSKRKDVLSSGMHTVIPAMEKAGIQRIVSLTGSEARDQGDTLSLIHRLMYVFLLLAAGKVLRDGENHIQQLRVSQLKWTVLRSPIMTAHQNSHYHLGQRRPFPWRTISRSAVVTALLDQLEDTSELQSSPYIYKAR